MPERGFFDAWAAWYALCALAILVSVGAAFGQMSDAEPACDDTGICRPFDDTADLCNCVFCGKELVKVGHEWRTWDWEFFREET